MEPTHGLTQKEWKLLRKEAEIDLKVLRGEKKPSSEALTERIMELAEEEAQYKTIKKAAA